jgi:hypothetical protein
MKMMFNTNASKGEKIPATSTRCFDSLPTLSSVPPVASRSVRFLVASRTRRFIPLSVDFGPTGKKSGFAKRNMSRRRIVGKQEAIHKRMWGDYGDLLEADFWTT